MGFNSGFKGLMGSWGFRTLAMWAYVRLKYLVMKSIIKFWGFKRVHSGLFPWSWFCWI